MSPGATTDGVTHFSLKNPTTFFSHRPLQSDALFSCRLLAISTFRRRLSSVRSKFIHKKLISVGCRMSITPWMYVSPEVVCPRPLVTPLLPISQVQLSKAV